MTAHGYEVPPIPPELALDDAPLPPDTLSKLLDAIEQAADDQGVPGAHHDLVRSLITDDVEVGPAARALIPEPARRWRISDDGQAEWAMRNYALAQEELDRLAERAAEWAKRISDWYTTAAKRAHASRAFFGAQLEDYALRVRDASAGKIKTVKLPSGDVKTRETKPKVVVGRPEEFAAWAAEHPNDPLVRVKFEAVADALKAAEPTEVPVAMRWVLVLTCGHEVETSVDAPADGEVLAAPPWFNDSHMGCPSCGEDPLDSVPILREVTDRSVELVRETRIVRDGEVLPWARVEPGGISANVVL